MIEITSQAFAHMKPIPVKYTGVVSPPLAFKNLPPSTKSIAIIVDDPDAPMGTFDHWIAWNLPSTATLEEGATVPMEGTNDFGEQNYRGPMPPPGHVHHYQFKVYALDTKLLLAVGSSKSQLEEAMEGHILDDGLLIGTYKYHDGSS